MTTKIPAGEFKAKCLALLDDVRDQRRELVVTKRGVPVARIVPMPIASPGRVPYGGRMKGTVQIHGDLFSTDEKWEAESA